MTTSRAGPSPQPTGSVCERIPVWTARIGTVCRPAGAGESAMRRKKVFLQEARLGGSVGSRGLRPLAPCPDRANVATALLEFERGAVAPQR